MKKASILIVTLFLSLSPFAYAQNFAGVQYDIKISSPEKSLNIGEKLEYSLEWLGVSVATVILKVEALEEINGSQCYHISAVAAPNKFFAKFYDVEYVVHTYIDKNTLSPRRFDKTRRMKGKSEHAVIDFYFLSQEVIIKSEGSAPRMDFSAVRKKMEPSISATATNKIPPGTQDVLSSLFYIRHLEIKGEETHSINIYYYGNNWPVNIKAEAPFLKDVRNKDSFAAFMVSVDSNLNAFIWGKHKLQIYFTADSRRIPIEFRLGTGLGPLRGILKDIPAAKK